MLTSSGLCLACGLKRNPDIPHKYLSQLPEQWRRCLTTSSLCGSFPSTGFREPPMCSGQRAAPESAPICCQGILPGGNAPGNVLGCSGSSGFEYQPGSQPGIFTVPNCQQRAWHLFYLASPEPGGLRTQGLAEARVISPAVDDATKCHPPGLPCVSPGIGMGIAHQDWEAREQG